MRASSPLDEPRRPHRVRTGRAARPRRGRTARRRAGRPRHGRLPPSDGRSPRVPAGAGRDLRARGCARRGTGRRCWSRAPRPPPRPRRSAPAGGSSSPRWTTARAWSTSPSSTTPTPPARTPSSTPGCCWCAGVVQRRGPRSLSVVGAAAWNLAELVELRRDGRPGRGRRTAGGASAPVGGRAATRDRRGRRGEPGRARKTPEGAGKGTGGRTDRRCPRGTRCTPGPTSGPPATADSPKALRKLWHSSPGSAG